LGLQPGHRDGCARRHVDLLYVPQRLACSEGLTRQLARAIPIARCFTRQSLRQRRHFARTRPLPCKMLACAGTQSVARLRCRSPRARSEADLVQHAQEEALQEAVRREVARQDGLQQLALLVECQLL